MTGKQEKKNDFWPVPNSQETFLTYSEYGQSSHILGVGSFIYYSLTAIPKTQITKYQEGF